MSGLLIRILLLLLGVLDVSAIVTSGGGIGVDGVVGIGFPSKS